MSNCIYIEVLKILNFEYEGSVAIWKLEPKKGGTVMGQCHPP